MRIEEFVRNGFDPDVTYSAGIVPIILGATPRILLLQEAEGEIKEQKDGTGGYRTQAWWKVPFGKRNDTDRDIMDIALRETLEETGCRFQKEQLINVVRKRAQAKRAGSETWHEDYFFLALLREELVPVQGIVDKKVCGANYFPLTVLPLSGRESGARGVTISQKHLWGIYSLCMEHPRTLSPHVFRYGNRVSA